MSTRRARLIEAALLALLFMVGASAGLRPVPAYTPKAGDSFSYSETIRVSNGQGSYAGYTDQTLLTGEEQTTSVNSGLVSANYSYSYQYSNSEGSSSSNASSGSFTWSSGNFTYVAGTDDQVGYSKPTYVWFAMNPSLPVGGTFYSLNTLLTVQSKNYSLQLPTENKSVQTVVAEGNGVYQRDDSYGVFNASYTWTEYFDPTTGYIIGYNYVEQDVGQYQGQAGSFTYSDDLYVTQTSYPLAAGNPSSATTAAQGSLELSPYVTYGLALVAILVVVAVVVYVAARRRHSRRPLPEHPRYESPPPPAAPGESKVDLGSRPPEQVVLKEVAMVNCKFCGALIPTTAATCPRCGAPMQ